MKEYIIPKGIKSWAEDDRPREKLLLKGRAALSDAELLAIQLGSGSRNETAVDLAKRILASVQNDLGKLARLGVEDLKEFKGVGEAKAINIIGALELGARRRQTESAGLRRICEGRDTFELLHPHLGHLDYEEFWIVFLGGGNKVLNYRCIGRGGLNSTPADKRMIFAEALKEKATDIVLAHNHPSGNLTPSHQDRLLTTTLKKAGELMEIRVMDHVIICEDGYYSFAEQGAL